MSNQHLVRVVIAAWLIGGFLHSKNVCAQIWPNRRPTVQVIFLPKRAVRFPSAVLWY